MSLIPYLFNEIGPRRLRDHLYGLDFDPEDLLPDIMEQPVIRVRRYVRPWRNLTAADRDVGSTIKSDRDKFQVNLDVQHFSPDEISVKTVDGYVVVEGKHEEKRDEHGFISRQFKRRYALPEGCKPEAVESRLSSDGVLTVVAPKESGQKGERSVPIAQTGPVRRKQHDEQNDEQHGEPNGDVEEQVKTPQKKRRR